jgi:hypothetical protein
MLFTPSACYLHLVLIEGNTPCRISVDWRKIPIALQNACGGF